jgi:hypothetical protein
MKKFVVDKKNFDLPIHEIIDPNVYVYKTKVIAILSIKGTQGEQKRKLLRSPKGGYMLSR